MKGDRGAGHQQIRGQRGTGGGRRGGRGVHEAGEEGAGSRISKVAGSGRNGKIIKQQCIILLLFYN